MIQEKMKTFRPFLVKLFFLTAFPIHLWSIFQTFQNIGWVAERTTWGDAFGYGSYALLAALVESFLIFLVTVPIFFLLTKIHPPEKALAITSLTYFSIALLWIFRAIMINNTGDQFFLDSFIHELGEQSGWRLRYRYLAILISIIILNIPIIITPVLAIKQNKLTGFLLSFADRVETLMYLFIGMDVIGIAVIIVRNVLGAL